MKIFFLPGGRWSKKDRPTRPGCYQKETLLFFFLYLLLSSPVSGVERGIVPLSIVDQSGAQVGLYKESHALVVGVTDYTAGWYDLPGVAEDIREVRKSLERHGFQVSVVRDPTHKMLGEAIFDFIHRYGQDADNRLLIYFAGHGHTVKLSYGKEMGYIVPADAPDPNRDSRGFLRKAIDMQQVEVYAKRIQAKHALFLFDSCFSGSFFGLSRAVPKSIGFKTGKPVRMFITSGSAGEVVSDDSIFRRLFVSALAGEGDTNNDGYVTGSELGEFLTNGVINYSRGSQHPQYGTIRDPYLDKGDFVFPLLKTGRQSAKAEAESEGAKENQDPENTDSDRLKLEGQYKLLDEKKQLAGLRLKVAEEKMRLALKQKKAADSKPAEKGRKIGAWIVYKNETAVDTRTGLLWMTRDFYNMERRSPDGWNEAMVWAEDMEFAGYADWRVPTLVEYKSIYDSKRIKRGKMIGKRKGSFIRKHASKPVGYPRVFESGGGYWYWTKEESDPSRCGLSLDSRQSCYLTFNFRDATVGARPPEGNDSETSSIRLVRDIK